MIVFSASFDSDTNPLDIFDSIGSSGVYPRLQTAVVRTGAKALELDNLTSGVVFVQKNLPNAATYFLGAAVFIDNCSILYPIFEFLDGSQTQIGLWLDASGHFQFYRGGSSDVGFTALGSSSTQALPFDCFHYIEVKVTVSNSSGSLQLNVDGTNWITLTAIDTQYTANPQIGAISLGAWDFGYGGGNFHAFMDDVYICDTTGVTHNTFLGNIQILSAMPRANGTANTWTRGGTDTGANFSQVNEIPPDDDTTYLEDSSATTVRAACKSGSTAADNGADFVPGSSAYSDFQGDFPVDPATGSAWGSAALTAAEFGVKGSDGALDRYLFPSLAVTTIIGVRVKLRAKNA